MVFECLTIFGIMLAIFFICIFRKNEENGNQSVLVIPFMLLPAVNVVAYFYSDIVVRAIPLNEFTTHIALDVIAIIVSGIIAGSVLRRIKSRAMKIAYLGSVIFYNCLLEFIILQDLYNISELVTLN